MSAAVYYLLMASSQQHQRQYSSAAAKVKGFFTPARLTKLPSHTESEPRGNTRLLHIPWPALPQLVVSHVFTVINIILCIVIYKA
jgi:hypothetical protein